MAITHPPHRRYVLRGRVVTMGPADVLDDGAVVVDGDTIVRVGPAADITGSSDGPHIRTGGTIYPGLVELHNHLSYNAMPLWDVPKPYTNNGQWRGIEPYTRRITKPSQVLGQTDGAAQALVRYAECRALLGGTTCSQGITLANASGTMKYYAGLLRNAEAPDDDRLPVAGTNIENPRNGGALDYRRTLAASSCYLQHLSEGVDDTARGWFLRLRIDDDEWAVDEHLCAIHCTALGPDDLAVLAERGATMVWSPLSNYLLYRGTADIRAAKDSGLRMCLGSDWAPSGTKNLLGELKVAALASAEVGGDDGPVFTSRELVEMVTTVPVAALKWDHLLGSIEPGKLADLVVLDDREGDPFDQLVDARETSVALVVIGGIPRVGQRSLMQRWWAEPLAGAPWIDEVTVGRSTRRLYLERDDDLLDGLPLSTAVETLSAAMADLPALAQRVDDAIGGATITAGGAAAFAGGMATGGEVLRVVPDFELDDHRSLIDAVGFDMAAEPYGFWVTEPIVLDPLTVVDDREHLRTLARAGNLPEFVKRGLPARYGQRVALPDAASFLEGAGEDGEHLRATTTDLPSVRAAAGALTLADRRLIVDQALTLLTEAYVHLPFKRAMHAVDPVQRLRLLRQRLEEATADDLAPELEFHAEVTATMCSLRDLHTGYRLPRPFGPKVAWLPFLVEEVWDRGERSYVMTRCAFDAWPDPRMAGATVTHWNGTPIETAVRRNAERTAGSNDDARHARGVASLTIRPLASGPPPDEDWVDVRWLDGDGVAHVHHQAWLVFEPGQDVGPHDLVADVAAIGVDGHIDDIQRARLELFAPAVAGAARASGGTALGTPSHDAADGLESVMPWVFRAMEVRRSDAGDGASSYGYVRIFTFGVPHAGAFVEEFARLVSLLPGTGLVIDVRGNGGGLIHAAEQLLQLLTPRRIEPQSAQFVNTPFNLRVCRRHAPSPVLAGFTLEPWISSIEESVRTGATFSRGFPITSVDDANRLGQRYHGPVALITDALSYSATDMFAAGFQDHEIGPVIGVGGATGAGGANVWTHGLLATLCRPDDGDATPSPLTPLPHGADLRVAVRRTTRVGARAGNVLEDLGVTPDLAYRMSRRDVLGRNEDLVDTAIDLLAARPRCSLSIERIERHRDRAPTLRLAAEGITHVDASVDGRRLATTDVRRGRVVLRLADAVDGARPGPFAVRVEGYDADGRLVASLSSTVAAADA